MKKPKTDDPAAVAHLFEKFAQSGYPAVKFTEPLYHGLFLAFGFIAHMNRDGFYIARFSTLNARVETLRTMTQSDWRLPTPLEIALRRIVEDRGLLAAAILERDAEIERAERAELARLKAKYG